MKHVLKYSWGLALFLLATPAQGNQFLIDSYLRHLPRPGNQQDPGVAFNGTNWLVAWDDDHSGNLNISAARVSPDGVVLDTSIVIDTLSAADQSPAVASDGTNWLVVWYDWNGVEANVYGARVAPNGAVLDPQPITICAASFDQEYPSVAFDGTNYLVVWEDTRNHVDIYGARVTPSGVVLDTAGFAVSTAPAFKQYPSVAFDGTNYLVTWMDWRSSVDYDIYGARVTPGATVLDTAGILISGAAGDQDMPSVAFGGGVFLVAWDDTRGGYNPDIYCARVGTNGSVLDPNGVRCSYDTLRQAKNWAAVAYDGVNFLVTWTDDREYRDIYGTRVSQGGVVMDTTNLRIAYFPDYPDEIPAIACADSTCLVVWQEDLSNGGPTAYEVLGTRVNRSGDVLDWAGIAITSSGTISYGEFTPAVASDGTGYLVTWSDLRVGDTARVYGTRVSSGGAILDPAGIRIARGARSSYDPVAAFGDSNYLVVWEDSRSGPNDDLYGAFVGRDGRAIGDIPISQANGLQEDQRVAFDGTNWLVAWDDDHSGNYDVYGARVSQDGTVLDPSGIPIRTGSGDQWDPDVAFDGTNYLVVWYDDGDIRGSRVTPVGVVLDPGGFAICTAADEQDGAAAAFDGTNYLVVWHDRRNGNDRDIYGARVTPAGAVLDPNGFLVCAAADAQQWPKVAFDGTNYRVVWEDYRNPVDSTDLYGAWVSTAGAVLGTFPISAGARNQFDPEICRGPGNQTLLVFGDWVSSYQGAQYDAYRTWGIFNPSAGIADHEPLRADAAPVIPTIVRGVIRVDSRQNTAHRGGTELLDIAGREVLDLHPGPNDVSRLAPGVYFLRSGVDGQWSAAKIVVTK